MNAEEALDYALARLEDLKEVGITVDIMRAEPTGPGGMGDASLPLEKLVAKYADDPNRLPPHRWQCVRLEAPTAEQMQATRALRDELCWMGIGFDVAGVVGGPIVDWGFDWSFQVGVYSQAIVKRRELYDNVMDAGSDGYLKDPVDGFLMSAD